ncbi:MAG: hypothetical protein WC967_15560 [Balneolaceae bacterium]
MPYPSGSSISVSNLTVSNVELGAGTLAALETVNATVSGEVELGATTLSALESTTVNGTVELGVSTLAALENITVEVGATSLAALETIELGTTTINALGGTVAASEVHSIAYEASHVIKDTAGSLLGFTGYNSGPTQWIHVYDSATLPADTAVPVVILKVAADDNFSWDSGREPYPFASGIVIANSTTGPTKTIGAADCWFNVLYR